MSGRLAPDVADPFKMKEIRSHPMIVTSAFICFGDNKGVFMNESWKCGKIRGHEYQDEWTDDR